MYAYDYLLGGTEISTPSLSHTNKSSSWKSLIQFRKIVKINGDRMLKVSQDSPTLILSFCTPEGAMYISSLHMQQGTQKCGKTSHGVLTSNYREWNIHHSLTLFFSPSKHNSLSGHCNTYMYIHVVLKLRFGSHCVWVYILWENFDTSLWS